MWTIQAQAQSLRLATWNADLSRDGPGLLLRDILSGKDPEVAAVIEGLRQVRPDVVLLTRFDHDLQGVALKALGAQLVAAGLDYPHHFAPPQNRGLATGLDLNGDGRRGGAEDAQGFGRFSGDGAMALLSRFPIVGWRDFSEMLWADLPDARLDLVAAEARPVQRLSSSAHWEVVLETPAGQLAVLAWAAAPPLFDRRNPDRNHDEAAFWLHLLDGALPHAPPAMPFVLAGLANLGAGQGDPAALQLLARHPALHPPPHGPSADLPSGPAALGRIQPSRALTITGHGLFPPRPQTAAHRLVWVDVVMPPP